MDRNSQKRINKNNRKRGGAFEKKCADILEMDVVPYSGSNARYGYGDIRDTIWLGECKNITPTNGAVKLEEKWFTKNAERAKNVNHRPFLVWMPSGKPDKFIVLDSDVFNDVFSDYAVDYVVDLYKPNATNMIIDLSAKFISDIKKGSIVGIKLHNNTRYMMNISDFNEIINSINMKGERQTDGL